MNDVLLNLSKNSTTRSLIKTLGLPVPLPQELRRSTEPIQERPIEGRSIGVYLPNESSVGRYVAETITEAGGNPSVAEETQEDIFESTSKKAEKIQFETDTNFDALVFDATALKTPDDLDRLYEFFHPLIGQLDKCGRIVIIGRPSDQANPKYAAAQEALEGFMRSASKEIGGNGSTINLLQVEEGAEENVAGPIRFFLSDRSAYINSQSIQVTSDAGTIDQNEWTKPLEGQVALVTGAARGIGAAATKMMAQEGATVVCLDLPADAGPVSQLSRQIDGEILLADVTDEKTPDHVANTIDELDGVDIVLNNAGITRDKTLKYMDSNYWDQALSVNLEAVVRITERILDDELFNENGRLLCMSSIAGVSGNKGQTNYASSKAGLIGFVRSHSKQLNDQGITANALAPGFIETRLTEEMPLAVREVARRMNNLSQGGTPEDVAQAITFLATPGAQGVTGQILRVCGGSMVGR